MKKLLGYLKSLGPGLIAGASDDDPTAIATYTQSGAQFGYHQLWTTLFTVPFMVAIQEMSARIGLVTGKGIAAIVTKHYSRYIIYTTVLLLLVANIVNIGADSGAIAASAQLLWNIPKWVYLTGFTGVILYVQLFVGYKKFAAILKYLTLALFAYVGAAFVTKQHWGEVFKDTVIPYVSLKKLFLLNLVAILGTNISPYLFFWQASEEVEEEVAHGKLKEADRGKPKMGKRDIARMRVDTVTGMAFSNVVLFFVEIAAAEALGAHGVTQVDTPSQAAQALKPVAGNFAFLLFAVGIIASGLLAIPVLSTSCAYAIAETLNQKATLSKNFREEPAFYLLIIGATVAGLFINFLPVKPFDLLVYSAAINGALTPFLILVILAIANNKTIMRQYTNSRLSNYFGLALAALMTLCSAGLMYSMVHK